MAKQKAKTPLEKLHNWHHTKHGYLLFGVAELLIAYGFVSWAIDNGQLWTYFIGVVFFAGGIQNIYRMTKRMLAEG
ncbi:MAG: hypothetical protein U5L95_05660 [Candidatus Saccharibacteria bacterium]|nr:hypothetical protein [Candidatus Saccharibacteria bacterium]